MKSKSQEAHYRIFCIPLFLPPSHNKYSPHQPALTNPQSVFFSWLKTLTFTSTKNDRNCGTFIDEYMQHSELHGSKYCLNLFCSFFPRSWSSIFVRLMPEWHRYFTCNVTYNKIAWDFTIKTAHNPFSTTRQLQKYR